MSCEASTVQDFYDLVFNIRYYQVCVVKAIAENRFDHFADLDGHQQQMFFVAFDSHLNQLLEFWDAVSPHSGDAEVIRRMVSGRIVYLCQTVTATSFGTAY